MPGVKSFPCLKRVTKGSRWDEQKDRGPFKGKGLIIGAVGLMIGLGLGGLRGPLAAAGFMGENS